MSATGKTHFRLCHICGTANWNYGDLVKDCSCCGKHLAPLYFFDESKAMGLPSTHKIESRALPHESYPAIIGLTAYWES
jgi:hypothetical protein